MISSVSKGYKQGKLFYFVKFNIPGNLVVFQFQFLKRYINRVCKILLIIPMGFY